MSFKVLMAGRRKRGQTLAEHRHHMKSVHGQLVLDYIAADLVNAPGRYVQNHVFDGIFPGGEGQPEPFALGLDFVTEIWAEGLAGLKAGRETEFYKTHLLPDEPGRVKVFLFWHGAVPTTAALCDALGTGTAAILGQSRCIPVVPHPVRAVEIFQLAEEAAALAFAQTARDAVRNHLPAENDNFSIAIANEYVLNAG